MKPGCLALAAALIVLAGAASPAAAAQGVTSLGEAVRHSIHTYPRFTIFDDVEARVEGETVLLSGKVTLAEKRTDLEQRVSSLPGVRDVRNEISVLPASNSDDALRTRVARAIYRSPAFWRYASLARPPIHILVEHGAVTLTGIVPSAVERALAESLATGHGEVSVTNALRLGEEAGGAHRRW